MPEELYRSISPLLVPVTLPLGMALSRPDETVDFLYFPVSGLISLSALTHSGDSVEVSLIGREGFAGVCGLLGQPQTAHSVVVQAPGSALRVAVAPMREAFLKNGAFAAQVHIFLYQQMLQMAQSVLCARMHSVDVRMARWLLTASDRIGSPDMPITQEILSQMLGSRRSTVTVAAGDLQRAGLIDYTRGRIRIVDRLGLEARACECYCIVRDTFERLAGRTE